MTKAATVDAIVRSATILFGDKGFKGVSLRDIAADAEIPLASIHRYFSSKADLFDLVVTRIWTEISFERETLLAQALDRPRDEVDLRDVVDAFIRPVVARWGRGDPAVKLLNKGGSDRWIFDKKTSSERNRTRRHTVRWIDALGLCLPQLDRRGVVWLYSFMGATLYSPQFLDRHLDPFLDDPTPPTVDEVTALMLSFILGGIRQAAAIADS